jgi:hypothetical protein
LSEKLKKIESAINLMFEGIEYLLGIISFGSLIILSSLAIFGLIPLDQFVNGAVQIVVDMGTPFVLTLMVPVIGIPLAALYIFFN